METDDSDPDSGLYPFHSFLFDVFEDDKPQQPDVQLQNVYEPGYEGTELRRAIRSGNKSRIENVLNVYLADFDTVREYLVKKYKIDSNDKIWFRKTILVASTEEQCRIAKNFEKECVPQFGLDQAILVLLHYPIDGERVSVLHPNESNRLKALSIVNSLIPNGFLSWNRSSYKDDPETVIEAAANCGNIELIQRLYDLGVELSIPGQNPLMAAVRQNRKETIEWLLTEHFDNFDCSARDNYESNAVFLAMEIQQTETMKYCFEKMLAYRQKYFNETTIEASNNILRMENGCWTDYFIFTFDKKKPGKCRKLVEQWIVEYQFDLTYQWRRTSHLESLIRCNCTLEYCWNGIRSNPELLRLNSYSSGTIIHLLVEMGHLEILIEMYECHPHVKQYFETDRAWEVLAHAIEGDRHEEIQFIMNHHSVFIEEDLDQLLDELNLLRRRFHGNNFYQKHGTTIVNLFPDLMDEIEDLKNEEVECNRVNDDLDNSFVAYNIENNESSIKIPEEITQLGNVKGTRGETLIHLAVQKNDKDLLIRLLEDGCDFDALDNDGNHAIHYVRNGDMLEFVLQKHPSGKDLLKITNADGYSVLHKICKLEIEQESHCELLQKALGHGANASQLTNAGESVIYFIRNCFLLDILLEHGVSLETVNNNNETALERHLKSRNAAMACALYNLIHEKPVFKEHAHKFLALIIDGCHMDKLFFEDLDDMFEKFPNTIKLLFDSLVQHSPEEASRIFSEACYHGIYYVLRKFLEFDYNLDYNYKGIYGYPIIAFLTDKDDYEDSSDIFILLKRLLEKGVDLNIKNEHGRNALMTFFSDFPTVRWGTHSVDSVKLMIDYGARVNECDNEGFTALHLAVAGRQWKLVEALLQNGADSSIKNHEGLTPLGKAQSAVIQELYYFIE
ncbi:uncharacterized protein LOC129751313 [Uranotaenia lowii]|uniref:uncharacterized protein LOC129751313 n=1 Tax=Uranotaenia lowii TaxID=190385 RepID=UPI0024796A55|nr:uncharacterized protein LOC129751313 [Uranotaenia lowii]